METSGRWRFAYVTALPPEDGKRRASVRGIADAPHSELLEANRLVREYGKCQSLIDAVAANFGELGRAIVERGVQFFHLRSLPPGELTEITDEYARLLANLLAMFRIFLDHTQTAISRQFGRKSQELKDWELATHQEYDTAFGYRIIYGLRNYCVHVGMPPLSVSFSAASGDPAVSFSLSLDLAELVTERSCWNAKLYAELAALQADIPFMDVLDEWSKSFWRVARAALAIQQKCALASAQQLLAYRVQFGLPEDGGELCAMFFPSQDENPYPQNWRVLHLEEALCRKVIEGPTWSPD